MCTTIFISVSSTKLDSPDPQTNLEGLNEAFVSFYAPAKSFGGTLRQFLTDDKGTVAHVGMCWLHKTWTRHSSSVAAAGRVVLLCCEWSLCAFTETASQQRLASPRPSTGVDLATTH